jgi:hypothetical protein
MTDLNTVRLAPLLSAFFLIATINTNAQKLPQKQNKSINAPVDIKIDGKITESESDFQAYNSANRIFYTISNDDTNLYLTICSKDVKGCQKILNAGVTFTIKSLFSTKEKVKDVSIIYPAIESKINFQHEKITTTPVRYNQMKKDAVSSQKLSDFIASTNQQLTSFYKEIQIAGIKEISDPVISIYNNTGVKANMSFNENMECNYELKIPLRYLTSKFNGNGTFKYNIKLNGEPTITSAKTLEPPSMPTKNQDGELLYLYNTTDITGEYTLATKL